MPKRKYKEIDDNSFKTRFFRSSINSMLSQPDTIYKDDETTICYHYTSASALMAILNTQDNRLDTGTVRFTDSRYMNDRSEHMFFIKRLLEFMENQRENFPFCQEVINEYLLKKHSVEDYINLRVFELNEPLLAKDAAELATQNDGAKFTSNILTRVKSRHFLFCLCRDSDSLHMWNYYIRNGNYQGYNIGIKPYDFLKNLSYTESEKHDPFLFYYGDVLYTREKQEGQIAALCRTIEDFQNTHQDRLTPLQMGQLILWSYIQCFGLFFKDESFANEQEYRIVIQFHETDLEHTLSNYLRTDTRNIGYSFFERNGILIPCLTVPLPKNAVSQITMAPILESSIASASIKEFLDSNGYSGVDVKQSTIPIRY